MFSEYVGLTQTVASEIETRRITATETKSDILARIFAERITPVLSRQIDAPSLVDLTQGMSVSEGELLYLYLQKPNSASEAPIAKAVFRSGEIYMGSKRVERPYRGNGLAKAMKDAQIAVGHVDAKGNPISLSAYRQWHVIRGGKLIPLEELKKQGQKRIRRTKVALIDTDALLAELGIK
jgi:hypothetical protein